MTYTHLVLCCSPRTHGSDAHPGSEHSERPREQAPKVPTSPDAWPGCSPEQRAKRATKGAGSEGTDQPQRLGCAIFTAQCDYTDEPKARRDTEHTALSSQCSVTIPTSRRLGEILNTLHYPHSAV